MLVTLDRRIAALTGLDTQPPYAEHLQVVNYGIGGHYEPHFDHATVTVGSVTRPWEGKQRVAYFAESELFRTPTECSVKS